MRFAFPLVRQIALLLHQLHQAEHGRVGNFFVHGEMLADFTNRQWPVLPDKLEDGELPSANDRRFFADHGDNLAKNTYLISSTHE